MMTQSRIPMNISLISHYYQDSVDLIEPVEEIAFSNQISSLDAYYSKKVIYIFKHA